MKVPTGGTKMWCPECKKITTCEAIPDARVQRKYLGSHPDLQWFQRRRKCRACGHKFLTGEADRKFLFELVELRDALAEIKSHAEQYMAESKQASETLEHLSKSLGALRALRLYKEA